MTLTLHCATVLFGVPLSTLVLHESTDSHHGIAPDTTLRIPTFIDHCLTALMQMGMSSLLLPRFLIFLFHSILLSEAYITAPSLLFFLGADPTHTRRHRRRYPPPLRQPPSTPLHYARPR